MRLAVFLSVVAVVFLTLKGVVWVFHNAYLLDLRL